MYNRELAGDNMRCRRRLVWLVVLIIGIGLILGSVIPCAFLYGVLFVAFGGWQLFC